MAEKEAVKPAVEPAVFSDADKARARQWFKKGADCREKRDYDYAIECYIAGLNFWPEAVEEGWMPLASLAVQRIQAGGKKPGMMETLKRPTSGKDAKHAMLNAGFLAAKDPTESSYVAALLKNSVKSRFLNAARFAAPKAYDALKREKKPDKAQFKAFRQALVEAADAAEAQSQPALVNAFLELAVQSLDYLIARVPDEDLKVEQRHLSGRLTITRGKYSEADSFRESLRDAEKQKILHDTERTQQSEQTYEALVAAAKREYEQDPNVAGKINAYVDILLKPERDSEESEAIAVLMRACEQSRSYSFKVRADDVRLRQLQRLVRRLRELARRSGSDEDRQQARLAEQEYRELDLQVYRERVDKYPTDLRLKARLGRALFESGQYDEAIPILQVAQNEPRSRPMCQLLMGRAFHEKGSHAQAIEVLKELLDTHELGEELAKQALYWLGRAAEAAGGVDEAKAAYGKLLRIDYNYAAGDARSRLEALGK